MKKTIIRVPASTGNLGPGFDCLGLALNLWNQVEFTIKEKDLKMGDDEIQPSLQKGRCIEYQDHMAT